MNLLLLEPGEIDGHGRVALADRRARHVLEVLGARAGDRLRVGVVRGARGTGTVLQAHTDGVSLEVALDVPPPPPPTVDLVVAVPRPKAVARLVEIAAAFGVGRLDLVNAWKVDKSYLASHRLAPPALREAALRGCEQGAHTWLPDLAVRPLLVPFLREVLAPRLAAAPSRRLLVAHPEGALGLDALLPHHDRAPLTCAVGPEGGWIEEELATFAGLGARRLSLGPSLLRVDVAAAALLAQLDLWRR